MNGPRSPNSDWSDLELRAAVQAYLKMLKMEEEGQPFVKAEINSALRSRGEELFGRTKASVEYRMQNISAVLADEGRVYVQGYRPAKNVGPNIRGRILKILREIESA